MSKEINIILDLPLKQPMNEIFAILATDQKGNEGIVSRNGLPLVFGEMGTLKTMLENLSEIAKMCGKKLRLCRFVRTEVIRESA